MSESGLGVSLKDTLSRQDTLSCWRPRRLWLDLWNLISVPLWRLPSFIFKLECVSAPWFISDQRIHFPRAEFLKSDMKFDSWEMKCGRWHTEIKQTNTIYKNIYLSKGNMYESHRSKSNTVNQDDPMFREKSEHIWTLRTGHRNSSFFFNLMDYSN